MGLQFGSMKLLSCDKDSTHTLATEPESDCEATCSRTDGRRICRVRFQETVEKYYIASHETYSDQERLACWYTPEEKQVSTFSCLEIIARMDAGKPEQPENPYRGLFCFTEKGLTELTLQTHRVVDAVLDEQDMQWDEGVDDYDLIASISLQTTALSLKRAREIASDDAQEALAIYGPMIDIIRQYQSPSRIARFKNKMTAKVSEVRERRRAARRKRRSKTQTLENTIPW